ncbi:NAD(P)-dependent oxidoreductase [Eubacterium sp. 1001713B170207_170306_E7]|uniref:NAD(P)-dependent oxidoreductase n=1 Tax=Eubacterium sp. 1001713B170207_170306_E7 TaxID=2787097 RepID=UPI001897C181|nr:NAD(P)-dependent oxidoreductase [Eubacterium sp. 1001713B170207_170306_E7]
MKIGFIGIGVMGQSMVRNLMKKGYEVSVYNRTKAKADAVVREGAHWCGSVADCAADKDVVITIVGYPKDVEEVYFGSTGIIENAREGAVLIDMTTTSPKLSKRIYEAAASRGIAALDAPVSGGDVGAEKGTLSIMAGGDEAVFKSCLPVFEAMGTNIIYEGGPGAGQHTKMANQIAIAGAVSGVCEALAYAKAVGLDEQTMLNSISAGAAGSFQMSNTAPRILKDDFAPGFFVKHYIKDMRIAREEAEEASAHLEVLSKVLEMYESLEKEGYGDLGTQALIKYYEQ